MEGQKETKVLSELEVLTLLFQRIEQEFCPRTKLQQLNKLGVPNHTYYNIKHFVENKGAVIEGRRKPSITGKLKKILPRFGIDMIEPTFLVNV